MTLAIRLLTADDLPAIKAVVLSNSNKKWLGLSVNLLAPEALYSVTIQIEKLIKLDYWRFFGAFDDAGNLLSVLSFYFWCKIENGKYIPTPPNFFGVFYVYTTQLVPLARTIDPGGYSDAYLETYAYAFKYFEEHGFTSRWVGIPADPKWRFVCRQPFGAGYDWDCTVVYKLKAGASYPEGYSAANPPPDWEWAGGPNVGWPVDSLIIRNDKKLHA